MHAHDPQALLECVVSDLVLSNKDEIADGEAGGEDDEIEEDDDFQLDEGLQENGQAEQDP